MPNHTTTTDTLQDLKIQNRVEINLLTLKHQDKQRLDDLNTEAKIKIIKHNSVIRNNTDSWTNLIVIDCINNQIHYVTEDLGNSIFDNGDVSNNVKNISKTYLLIP